MKAWKVILATLVIFAAGAIAGVLVSRSFFPIKTTSARFTGYGMMPNADFFRWVSAKINLSPAQLARIENIIKQSHDRMKPLREMIDPVMEEEVKRVKEEIDKELTPEQQQKLQEMFKKGPRRPEGHPPHDGKGPPPQPSGDSRFGKPPGMNDRPWDWRSGEPRRSSSATSAPPHIASPVPSEPK